MTRRKNKGDVMSSISLLISKKRRLVVFLSLFGLGVLVLIILILRYTLFAETVTPSVTGAYCKYLITYGPNIYAYPDFIASHLTEIEQKYPYDGVGIQTRNAQGGVLKSTPLLASTVQNDLSPLMTVSPKPTKLKHNLFQLLVHDPGDMFNDTGWAQAAANARIFAQELKRLDDAGFGVDGILFDNEGPYGVYCYPHGVKTKARYFWNLPIDSVQETEFTDHPDCWPYIRNWGTYSADQYNEKARQRGFQIMNALIDGFSDIKFVFMHSSTTSCKDSKGTHNNVASSNEMMGSFAVGLGEAAAARPTAKVIDGGEESYGYRTDAEFNNSYNFRKTGMLDYIYPSRNGYSCAFIPTEDRTADMWQQMFQFAFAMYNDPAHQTSTTIGPSTQLALEHSDKFVWFYVEGVTTIGNDTDRAAGHTGSYNQIGSDWTNALTAARAAVPNDPACEGGIPPETPPVAPSNLTASAVSSSQINLSWADNSDNETGFKIERSLTSGSGFSQIATVSANTTSFQNTGLSASTKYYFRLRAYNGVGDSSYSNETNATTQAQEACEPAAPTDLVSTIIDRNQVVLTWVDNSTNENGFSVERKLALVSTFSIIGNTGANSTSYTDLTVSPSTSYNYRVRAFNGCGAGVSDYTNILSVTTLADTPPAPTNFIAAGGPLRADLSWTDNSTNETGFKIERSLTAGSGFTQIATVGSNITSYRNSGLTAYTTYYYRVYAYNINGNSGYSNIDSATPWGDTEAPSAPTNLAGSAISSSEINLVWTASTDNIGVVGYYIYRNGLKVGSTSGTSYTDNYLLPNTTYTYQVTAFDQANNESNKSNSIQVTTQVLVDNPPQISITNPAAGVIVSATISVTANVSDDKGILKVDFYLDGIFKYSDSTAPYSWTLDTTAYFNGNHTIKARAYDTSGQYADDDHTVDFQNRGAVEQVIISNVKVSKTFTTATISWKTNLPATSQVRYGPSYSYGFSSLLDTNYSLNHSVTLIGLNPRTTYYFQIISTTADSIATYQSKLKTTGPDWKDRASIFF
jgi:chitodextrinase